MVNVRGSLLYLVLSEWLATFFDTFLRNYGLMQCRKRLIYMGRAAFKAVELLLRWLVGSTPTSSANYDR